jgi:hypothetical protein
VGLYNLQYSLNSTRVSRRSKKTPGPVKLRSWDHSSRRRKESKLARRYLTFMIKDMKAVCSQIGSGSRDQLILKYLPGYDRSVRRV